ncbi:MAG: hypothetical protein GY800_06515 [Planctomycetes bacterium]|nr:hypothetical protein [Planctomycetota bacterium]
MKWLFLTALIVVPALSGATLAATDPEIQELLERLQVLEKTVENQNRENELQRREIEALKDRKAARVVKTSRVVTGPPQEISLEKLQDVVKDYLNTEQGKELVAKSSPAKLKAGYKKGFYLQSLDDRFKLKINNRLQVRYTWEDNDGSKDTSSFRIRRYKVKFSGHAFTKNLTYKVQWNLPSYGGIGKLEDAWANYKVADFLQFRGGQYKVPFNREKLISSGKLQFVDRSIANGEFNLSRDIGVMAHAKPMNGLFEYYLAIMSGAGANREENTNTKMMYAVRGAVNPLGEFKSYSESDLEYEENPKVALGGAFVWNDGTELFVADDDMTFNKPIVLRQTTADIMAKWRGFSILSDFYWRDVSAHLGESTFPRHTNRGYGYTVQAGYFVPVSYLQKHLEFAGRYSFFDPNTNVNKDSEREIGGGVNWFFNGHKNKLQADVTSITRKQGSGEDDEDDLEFRTQYQLAF